MEITVNENGTIELRKVYNPIKLVSDSGEVFIITMRDHGYEICYENMFYELKDGVVNEYKNK